MSPDEQKSKYRVQASDVRVEKYEHGSGVLYFVTLGDDDLCDAELDAADLCDALAARLELAEAVRDLRAGSMNSSPALKLLADRALESIAQRESEDHAEWAKRLADDVARADD